jgi:hypothetical protein
VRALIASFILRTLRPRVKINFLFHFNICCYCEVFRPGYFCSSPFITIISMLRSGATTTQPDSGGFFAFRNNVE